MKRKPVSFNLFMSNDIKYECLSTLYKKKMHLCVVAVDDVCCNVDRKANLNWFVVSFLRIAPRRLQKHHIVVAWLNWTSKQRSYNTMDVPSTSTCYIETSLTSLTVYCKKNLSQRCSANMFNGTSVSVYFEWTTQDKTFKWMHNLYHVFSVLSSWSQIAMIKFFPHRMRYGKIQTTLMLLENS